MLHGKLIFNHASHQLRRTVKGYPPWKERAQVVAVQYAVIQSKALAKQKNRDEPRMDIIYRGGYVK